MKQATLTFMAGHLATKAQQQELRKTFNQFDENGDGLIQTQEFINGYSKLYPKEDQQAAAERALEVFNKADTDGSGAIDFTEWCTASIDQNTLMNEQNMLAAFKLFDKDGGGTIEAAEISKVLGQNAAANDEVWQAVIAEVDQNDDGLIDFDEFKTMLLKLADKKVPDSQ